MVAHKSAVVIGGLLAAIVLAGCSTQPHVNDAKPVSTEARSTTATTTTTATTSAKPVLAITLGCYMDSSYGSRRTFTLDARLDFSAVWTQKPHSCEATRSTDPLSAVEQQALAASGYDSPEDIKTLYGLCAEVDDTDVYVSAGFAPSSSQIKEITGMLTLCPNHPHTARLTEAINRGQADGELEASGQLFSSGTYRVGDEIQPGTYAIDGDIEDCYWERTNHTGQIIDNSFINGAKRVQVTIRSRDYSFHSEGCGTWRRVR